MLIASEYCGCVHVVQRMAPGGIETLVLDLVATGSDADLIVSLEGTCSELIAAWPRLADFRDRLVALDCAPGLKPRLVAQLFGLFRHRQPKAVILHHVGPLVYGGLAARLAGIGNIIHVEHDVWHYEAPRRRLIARLMQRVVAPSHIAVSYQAASELRKIVGTARITVVHNGVDMDRLRPGSQSAACATFGLPQGVKIVGSVGRAVPVKAQGTLVRAAALLPEYVHIVIAGDGPELPSLKVLATECGVSDRVHFLGHVDGVERLLPAFDVFCLPSRAEGFPRSVVEAQAAGVPVVASDVGAMREALCKHNSNLFKPLDHIELANALRDRLSRSMTKSPREFIAGYLDWNLTVAKYRDVSGYRHAV